MFEKLVNFCKNASLVCYDPYGSCQEHINYQYAESSDSETNAQVHKTRLDLGTHIDLTTLAVEDLISHEKLNDFFLSLGFLGGGGLLYVLCCQGVGRSGPVLSCVWYTWVASLKGSKNTSKSKLTVKMCSLQV